LAKLIIYITRKIDYNNINTISEVLDMAEVFLLPTHLVIW